MRKESSRFSRVPTYGYPVEHKMKEHIIKEEARKFEEKIESDLRLIGLGSGGVCYPSHSPNKGENAWTH